MVMLCSGYKAIHLPFISESGDYLSIAIELQSSFWGRIKTCRDPVMHTAYLLWSANGFLDSGLTIASTGYKKGKGRKRGAGTCAI